MTAAWTFGRGLIEMFPRDPRAQQTSESGPSRTRSTSCARFRSNGARGLAQEKFGARFFISGNNSGNRDEQIVMTPTAASG